MPLTTNPEIPADLPSDPAAPAAVSLPPDPLADPVDDDVPDSAEYSALIAAARAADLSDVERREILRAGEVDAKGRPCLVVVGAKFDNSEFDKEKLLQLFCLLLDDVAHEPYSVVYFHGGVGWWTAPPLLWLVRSVGRLPRRMRKNVACVAVVHPTNWVRAAMVVLWPWLSAKVEEKLVIADRLDELWLDGVVNKTEFTMPPEAVEFEAEQRRELEETRQAMVEAGAIPDSVTVPGGPEAPS